MLPALLIAAVSNLDNLSVGVAVGVFGSRIAAVPNMIIAAMTMAGTAAAMSSGHALSKLVATRTAASLGSVIIIGVGAATIVASLAAVRTPRRSPEFHNSYREALALGFALSLNNIGAGVGAGIAGVPPLATTLFAGAFSLLCVGGGSWTGKSLARPVLGNRAPLVSGLALVAIGIAMLPGVR
jgi:putative Mn2+ efflux pump MntP